MKYSYKTKKLPAFVVLITMLSFFIVLTGPAYSKRIVFFTPTSENNTYWPQVYEVVKKVAADLDMQIDIYQFDVGNRFAKHVEGTAILKKQPKPDGAVFSVAFGNSKPLLETAESLGIPVFIQGPLFPSELPILGNKPRNVYSQWIGYFYQDEFEKGYLLAKTLLKRAHDLNLVSSTGSIRVAGIGGDASWFGSKLRQDGLIKAVQEDPKAQLLQIVPTQWTEEEATQKTILLLNRYKEINVLWAASDQLGIGVAKALAEQHHSQNRPILTGGLDLSLNGLKHVQQEKLTATVGASIVQYAEIFIYLYDFLQGIDFANEITPDISSPLHIAKNENVAQYISLLSNLNKIDFTPFSKHLNPELEHYDFSVEKLSKNIQEE